MQHNRPTVLLTTPMSLFQSYISIRSCNYAKYSPISKKFTQRLSNNPFLIWLLTTPLHQKYAATLPCSLSLRACFADINVSQGSVATQKMCDGIFNIHLTANLPRNFPVKFFNRLRFDRIMVTSLWSRFSGPPCMSTPTSCYATVLTYRRTDRQTDRQRQWRQLAPQWTDEAAPTTDCWISDNASIATDEIQSDVYGRPQDDVLHLVHTQGVSEWVHGLVGPL